jgi:hypothetical protein
MTEKLSSNFCVEFCYSFDCRLGIPHDVGRSSFGSELKLTLPRANTQGLIDGGLAGVFWSYIWTYFGFGFVILSLAEMASM